MSPLISGLMPNCAKLIEIFIFMFTCIRYFVLFFVLFYSVSCAQIFHMIAMDPKERFLCPSIGCSHNFFGCFFSAFPAFDSPPFCLVFSLFPCLARCYFWFVFSYKPSFRSFSLWSFFRSPASMAPLHNGVPRLFTPKFLCPSNSHQSIFKPARLFDTDRAWKEFWNLVLLVDLILAWHSWKLIVVMWNRLTWPVTAVYRASMDILQVFFVWTNFRSTAMPYVFF